MSNMIELSERNMVGYKEEAEATDYAVESSRIGVWLIVSMSALVGLWGSVCLFSGLGSCESLSGIGRALVTAMTGM